MSDTEQDLEQLYASMRPRLHRYCARMAGSAIDGEDIVQETLMKAFTARQSAGTLDNPQAWLFRIAHNAALDFIRHRARLPSIDMEQDLDAIAAPDSPDPDIAAACLHSFLRLPALQRSAVILKDVLDHSLAEAAAMTATSEAAVKSALQRGRARLRSLAQAPEAAVTPTLDDAVRARLFTYVDGFKTGDFDAIRAMLADDVRLELVARLKRNGKNEVGEYLGRYGAARQWAFAPGLVEGRPAMLVFDRASARDTPAYFVILGFAGELVSDIRDFLFARYATEAVDMRALG